MPRSPGTSGPPGMSARENPCSRFPPGDLPGIQGICRTTTPLPGRSLPPRRAAPRNCCSICLHPQNHRLDIAYLITSRPVSAGDARAYDRLRICLLKTSGIPPAKRGDSSRFYLTWRGSGREHHPGGGRMGIPQSIPDRMAGRESFLSPPGDPDLRRSRPQARGAGDPGPLPTSSPRTPGAPCPAPSARPPEVPAPPVPRPYQTASSPPRRRWSGGRSG